VTCAIKSSTPVLAAVSLTALLTRLRDLPDWQSAERRTLRNYAGKLPASPIPQTRNLAGSFPKPLTL
jgi:hypothetical protein